MMRCVFTPDGTGLLCSWLDDSMHLGLWEVSSLVDSTRKGTVYGELNGKEISTFRLEVCYSFTSFTFELIFLLSALLRYRSNFLPV